MKPVSKTKREWLCDRARQMRKEQSLAERFLWDELRGWSRAGLRFRRQYVIGPYIADLACPLARVIVELDGSSHGSTVDEDEQRSGALAQDGWEVLRFHNLSVMEDSFRTAKCILHVCAVRMREYGVTVSEEAARYLQDYT